MASQLLLANPKKRRRRRRSSKSVAKSRRRYRRNPIAARSVVNTFKKGAVGAAGALAVDVAMQKLPIPAQFQTGPMGALAKGGVGILIGMGVSKFGKNRRLGEELADGAVTVSLYNLGKSMVGPSLGLGDASLLGAYSWPYDDDDMGYLNPASTVDMDDDLSFLDVDAYDSSEY